MSLAWPSDFQFAHPWVLALLLLLPVLAWFRGHAGRAPAVAFPGLFLVRDLGNVPRARRGWVHLGLIAGALAAGIIALARPQKIVSFDEVKSEGIAIALTVDVSLSMLIEDFFIGARPVNRLTAAKRVMRDFIQGREHDRVGITAFAGAPYHPCPLTLDHEWLENNIDRVQTGIMEDGTAIGSGIAAAANRLIKQDIPSKVIILLTDGANNSGKLSPQDAARLAATWDIRIYTIAIGTAGVHLIPLPNGRTITSGRQEFDEATLQEVARIGKGAYYRAQDLRALENIFKTIDQLEKTEIKKRNIVETHDLFHWPALAAASALLLGLLLSQTLQRTAPESAAA